MHKGTLLYINVSMQIGYSVDPRVQLWTHPYTLYALSTAPKFQSFRGPVYLGIYLCGHTAPLAEYKLQAVYGGQLDQTVNT